MIELPPQLKNENVLSLIFSHPTPELSALIDKANENYEFWDTVKYKQIPNGYSAKDLWTYIKAERLKKRIEVWPKYGIHFSLTSHMQGQCHEFDMNFGGSWESNTVLPENKERYLISSLMEEAISSSQMEGAATTRKVAKEMLRKRISPKDKSQQMIFNNYQTIQFIVANKDKDLTPDLLLNVHRLMTSNTLENEVDAGNFRQNNEVVVEDGITREIVHTPPSYEDIPGFVDDFCKYFNEVKNTKVFIHPIIRGIIIHFMLAYMHPFVDGNGRTARAVFYWYILKQGYWLIEYLSISRIIAKAKKSYEKSFLYAETDCNDMGYFVAYNLRVLDIAFKELQRYIKRKMDERRAAATFLRLDNINERQAEIIKLYYDTPKEVLTVKDIQKRFFISPTTAKNDILGLMNLGILSEISFNKVKKGYIRGEQFDEKVNKVVF